MSTWLILLSMLVMFVLQTTVFQIPPLNAIDPSLTLVMVLYVAYFRSTRQAMLLGGAVGLVQDTVYGTFIGMHTFAMMVTAYLAGAIFRLFLRRSLVVFLLVVLGGTAFYEALTFGINRLITPSYFDVSTIVVYIARTVIFNGVAALFLYSPSIRILLGKRRRYDHPFE